MTFYCHHCGRHFNKPFANYSRALFWLRSQTICPAGDHLSLPNLSHTISVDSFNTVDLLPRSSHHPYLRLRSDGTTNSHNPIKANPLIEPTPGGI